MDQRNQLINQLSGLIDVSKIDAGNGNVTLTTTSGAAARRGKQEFSVDNASGRHNGISARLFAWAIDITSSINGGSLGGAIQVSRHHDSFDPFVSRFAGVEPREFFQFGQSRRHRSQRQSWRQFFCASTRRGHRRSRDNECSAITDPSQIAASLDGSAGDNANVNAMLALQNQASSTGRHRSTHIPTSSFRSGMTWPTAQSEAARRAGHHAADSESNRQRLRSFDQRRSRQSDSIPASLPGGRASRVAINTLTSTPSIWSASHTEDIHEPPSQSQHRSRPARFDRAGATERTDCDAANGHGPQRQQSFRQSRGRRAACEQQRAFERERSVPHQRHAIFRGNFRLRIRR